MQTVHKIVTWLSVAVLLVVALGVLVSFQAFKQMKEASEERKHTFIVINSATELMSALKDAETGQRGYALTGDETFLETYLAVRDNVGGRLKELRELTLLRDAHKHLDALAPLMDAKMAEMSHVIDLRRRNDMTALQAAVGGSKGKRLMDLIRAEMKSFIQIEENALIQRDAKFQSDMRRLFAFMAIASLFTLLLALSFAWLTYRESQQRLKNLVHLETQRLLQVQEDLNKQLQKVNYTLQVSEEKLAVTLNSIGDGVIATDADGRVTLLNPLAEKLTGWMLTEAAGLPIDEIFRIINQETRKPSTVPVKETLEKGTVQGLANHTILIARDGSECVIADSCAPIRNRDGRVIGAVLVFRDVTEGREIEIGMEKTLKELAIIKKSADEASEFAENLINTVRKPLIALDQDLRVVKASRSFYDFFKVTTDETIGKLIYDLGNHQWDIPKLRELLETILPEKATFDNYQVEHDFSTIGRRIMLLNARQIQRVLGKERIILLAIEDITERKQAEEELIKAGALQAAIFNSANFSSIATDAEGVIQIFNVGAERMLGYAAADVMNKITPADISDPQEVIARAKTLSSELSTHITPGFEALVFKASRGIEDIYELTYIRKDGSRFPAVVSVTALRDAQNTIIGYLLIGTDNTARKQIEADQKKLDQRLRDQQFYTRSLIESNIDAIMTTDPASIITDVNRQMEFLTGCTRDELIGAPFKNYFTDPEEAEASIKLVLSKKKVNDYELTVHARDGKKTVVSFNANTFYDRDRTLQGVFATARDVTERKRNEKALQETNIALEGAKSVAEKANLAKSDFLSSMSHELRSPLNAILGFAQLMDSASPLPTDSQKENIAQILQAGWHLLKLINEILDLAVIESGKVSLSRESVSLSDVMSECQTMMESQAKQRGIGMTFPKFDKPLFVSADRTRLKQIVINLLSNAIKYNREGGSVSVDCTVRTSNRIRISVADTGAGLSPEKLVQLFQPFNRLGQEARSVAGTGIGLVVTKRLAELMDGVLGVDSTVGEGSVFWCELASAKAPKLVVQIDETEIPVQLQLPVDALKRTLLYVEDNPANMKLVEQLISRFPDIRLLTAVNGILGVKLASSAHPDVILMDINLPGISGVEALKILCKSPDTAHIPVVALSANAMPRDIEKGLEAGFFRYITKPIKVKEFMETLNAAMEHAAKRKG
jgi:PAS domain S-box-containing protein